MTPSLRLLPLSLILCATGAMGSDIDIAALAPARVRGYAVDSVNGDDLSGANTCQVSLKKDLTTVVRGTPCKTIARLRTVAPPAGANILLARGSYWREMIPLASAPNGGSILAYGSGARPVFDASDIVGTSGWTKSAGYTNIYQHSWTLDSMEFDATNSAHRVWETGTRLIRATSLANCDATPGSFYAAAPTSGTDTVYVHASDNGDPTSNGKTYEFAKRMWGINAGRYIGFETIVALIDGVHTKRNAGGSGSLLTAGIVKNSVAEDGYKHNFWVGGQCIDSVAWKHEPTPFVGGFTAFITYYGANATGASYTRCVAISDSGASNNSAFYAHTDSTSHLIARMTYTDSIAIGFEAGFSGSNAEVTDSEFTRVSTYKCATGVDVAHAVNSSTITDSNFIRYSGTNFTAVKGSNGAPVTTNINRIRMVEGGSGGYAVWFAYGTTVNLTNSVFVAKNNGIFLWNKSGLTVNFNNNILYVPAGKAIDFQVKAGVTYVGDRNIETFTLGFANFRMQWTNGTNYNTLANWRTASSQDANSLDTNPLFAGDPTTGDTTLAANSPALTLPAGPDAGATRSPALPDFAYWEAWTP